MTTDIPAGPAAEPAANQDSAGEITDCAHMWAVPYADASPADREGMHPGQWRCKDDGGWREPPAAPCGQVFDSARAWQQALQVHYAAHHIAEELTAPGSYGQPLDTRATIALVLQLLTGAQAAAVADGAES
jgi:hypothetical protein